ncbi:chemotaxis protein MotB [Mariprofundus micogutta]|uniref:Chemotaxis protein MotB n=1 Tax=Mariprofundus micogutta TaxID=1921010 RepID=A0A1L8CKF8_9PROT|nr:OmpA family protein [Mariprofundus micogutta]GAV19408.1 chemotaxis protein MotB [Mariprofundus micogutta]
MAKRDKKPPPLPFPADPGAALFLELMMQMLAFFILLTSYAVIVEDKRLAAIGSLAGTFNPMPRGANLTKGQGPALPTRDIVDGASAPKRTAKELTDISKELGMEDSMQVLPLDQDTVRIRFSEHIAFATGKTTLSDTSLALVDQLAESFKRPEVVEIQIEGHTDDLPTRGSGYSSNWELSAARAMSVFHALEQRGVATSRMIAAGMSDKHPIADRPDLARRVDITLKFRPVTDQNVEKGQIHELQRSVISAPKSSF